MILDVRVKSRKYQIYYEVMLLNTCF